MMLITMYAIHSQAAEKDRQQRAQDKAEVCTHINRHHGGHITNHSPQCRAQLKEALQLDRYALPAETAEPAAPQADVFEAPQYTTIVTTQAMAEGSSDEEAQPDGCVDTKGCGFATFTQAHVFLRAVFGNKTFDPRGGPRDEGSSLGAVQAAVRQQRQAKRAAEAQRTARQAARRQDKKLMQQLKAAKGTSGFIVCILISRHFVVCISISRHFVVYISISRPFPARKKKKKKR